MKKFLALLLALVMLLALVACGTAEPAADDAADDAAADDAAADDAAADDAAAEGDDAAAADGFDWAAYEGTKFQIMWQETDDTQIDIVKNFVQPALQEISDEYGIEFEYIGNVGDSYTTLAATGDLADVWFGNTTMEMMESNIVLDLAPYLTSDTYLEDNFLTPDFFWFNGKIWSLSSGVDSFYNGTLYYNKAIFEECGVTFEDIQTYDGLVAACEKIVAKGHGALTIDKSSWQQFLWENCVVSVNPDAYKALIAGEKDVFTKYAADFEASFAQIQDLTAAGYTPNALNVRETSDSMADFGLGNYAMLYVASWQNGGIASACADSGIEVGTSWWPSANADVTTGDFIAGWGSPLSGWTAKADTEYPELAVAVIKEIVKAEAARHLNAGLGTNFFQDGTPTPANDLEASRFELRANVGAYLKGYYQNTIDGATQTEFTDVLFSAISEDAHDNAALVAQMDAAWQTNTFFGE